jgi:four helix bundle protein
MFSQSVRVRLWFVWAHRKAGRKPCTITEDSLSGKKEFGLTSQIRRSAVSIVSNIAEGSGRRTTKDFYAFMHVARGSLAELETQLTLAHRIGLQIDIEHLTVQLNEMGKLVNGVLRGLERRMKQPTE